MKRKLPFMVLQVRIVLILGFRATAAIAEVPTVENLGGSWESYIGGPNLNDEWLTYSQYESFSHQDLNGDGDQGDAVVQLRHLESGEITNLALTGAAHPWREEAWILGDIEHASWRALSIYEWDQEKDLNGDGDTSDVVIHAVDVTTKQIRSLGLDGGLHGGRVILTHRDWILFETVDLNNRPVEVRNLKTDETVLLSEDPPPVFVEPLAVFEDRMVFIRAEGICVASLHTLEFSSGEIQDLGLLAEMEFYEGCYPIAEFADARLVLPAIPVGEEREYVHVYDFTSGELRNLGLAARYPEFAHGRWVLPVEELDQGEDLDGDGTAGTSSAVSALEGLW